MKKTTFAYRTILDTLRRNNLLVEVVRPPRDENRGVAYPHTDTRRLSERFNEDDVGTAKKASKRKEKDFLESFICIRGLVTDGHKYIKEAITMGAGVVFCEEAGSVYTGTAIVVRNSRKALAILAKLFFDNPSKKLTVMGITGTNGKTSTVKIIEQILLEQNQSVASIGTLGYTINGVEYPLERTTPDITELNQILEKFVEEKIEFVVMEVSSHALKLDRVFGLHFDCGLFTNLSREHLDFHPDMDDYFQSKVLLFDYVKQNKGTAFINIDDAFGEMLYNSYEGEKIALSTDANIADVCYAVTDKKLNKTVIKLSVTNKLYPEANENRKIEKMLETKLIGNHNAFNTVAAIIVSGIAQLKNNAAHGFLNREHTDIFLDKLIDKAIASLPESIKGRLEQVAADYPPLCYIDYAHTPQALEFSCKALKEIMVQNESCHSTASTSERQTSIEENKAGFVEANEKRRPLLKPQKRLIVVFGAGGDRDKGKRREMMDAVLKEADLTIITSDNPRFEHSLDIIFDLIEENHPLKDYWIAADRKEAIKTAINVACEDDIVLIAGKGHEKYQSIRNEKIYFSDYHEAKSLIEARNNKKREEDNRNQDASPPTTLLDITIDPAQIMLLLYCCEKEDIRCFRWEKNKPKQSKCNLYRIRNIIKEQTGSKMTSLKYISTDTRSIKDYSLFIALKGENFDGHDYLSEALAFPNNYAVVNYEAIQPETLSDEQKRRLIPVPDTLQAMALLAKKYKSLFNRLTVAITGSVGKTSTKEYCYNILSQEAFTLKNIANENNIIGIARTLFNLSSHYRYVVLEVGTNQKGEMELLADTCRPDIGIIINIEASHLEAFKSLQGVYGEKITLLDRELKLRIIPQDEELFFDFELPHCKLQKHRISECCRLYFVRGTTEEPEDHYHYRFCVILGSMSMHNHEDKNIAECKHLRTYYLPTDISFLADNVSFAIAAARFLGIEEDQIQKGISRKITLKNRMEIVTSESKDTNILFDCYNANPRSMKEAIKYWADYHPAKKHIAVLGDMLELGNDAREYHIEIRNYLRKIIKEKSLDSLIISIGNDARHYEGDLQFDKVEDLIKLPDKENPLKTNNCTILLKGSRGVRLDKLRDFLRVKG